MPSQTEPSQKKKIVKLNLGMEEFEPLGATPDERLVITAVQPNTIADGEINVSDRILSVNGTKIKNRAHFYRLLHCHAAKEGQVTLEIERSEGKPKQDTSGISSRQYALVGDRRNGYDYTLASIDYDKNKRVGFTIMERNNRVIVSQVFPGPMAEGKLKLYDHIIAIDDIRVTDQTVAHEVMGKGFKSFGRFVCLIGRPVSEEAIAEAKKNTEVRADEPPSVKWNLDVRKIAQAARIHHHQFAGPQEGRRGMIDDHHTPGATTHARFDEGGTTAVTIGNDNRGKDLRPVQK